MEKEASFAQSAPYALAQAVHMTVVAASQSKGEPGLERVAPPHPALPTSSARPIFHSAQPSIPSHAANMSSTFSWHSAGQWSGPAVQATSPVPPQTLLRISSVHSAARLKAAAHGTWYHL